jgi:hypothetical protein
VSSQVLTDPLKASAPRADGQRVLEMATFLGLGLVAIWFHIRFPRLQPRSLTLAVVHLALSMGLFSLAPDGVGLCLRTLPGPLSIALFVVAILVPTLTYVLLSWLWFIARLSDLLGSTPRGGHPARASAS